MISDFSKNIFCTGLSYKESSIALREMLSFPDEEIEKLLLILASKDFIKEVLVLSTCNRFEIYGVFNELRHLTDENFHDLWNSIFKAKSLSADLRASLKDKTYSYSGDKGIFHAFKVFTSLDSLCIGETQITGQFKKSLYQSQKQHSSGPVLKRLCHDAILLNKKIRNQTLLGRNEKSVGQMAIDLSLHIFNSIKDKSIVLIGAGKMIDLAFKHARCFEPRSITIVNRTKEKAEAIVAKCSIGKAVGLDQLEEKIIEADIVLSCTSAPYFILESSFLLSLQKKRKNKPLFLIDIALPRDVDPKSSELEEVYLFDLDDIRKVIKMKNENQKEEIKKAEILVEQKSNDFKEWVSHNIEVEPVLSDLGAYLKDIFAREEERTLGKALFKEMSTPQKNALKRMFQSVSQKILSDTAKSIKEESSCTFDGCPNSQRKVLPFQKRIG